MNTKQKDVLTMYQTVILFFGALGAPLAAIKLIGAQVEALKKLVQQILAMDQQQDQDTTGTTGARTTLKQGIAPVAEGLRLVVRALSGDDKLKGALKQPVSKRVSGDDDAYVKYLQAISDGMKTLDPVKLADLNYDPKALGMLDAALLKLTGTAGATRQIEIQTEAATDTLVPLFQAGTRLFESEQGLDALVHTQRLHEALVPVVDEYDKARRIQHTHGERRRPIYKGTLRYGAPVVVYDRQLTAVPSPVLGNKSGKGIGLFYYTAATPDGPPTPGKGLLVKNRAEHHLESYDKLGEPDARYLLVLQREMAGEGRFYVWG